MDEAGEVGHEDELPERERLLSQAEAAAHLGIRPQRLSLLSKRGDGPISAGKDGRRVVYRLSDLDAYDATGRIRKGNRGRKKKVAPPKLPPIQEPEDEGAWMRQLDGILAVNTIKSLYPQMRTSLEGVRTWPSGVYLTPIGLLVRP